MTDARNFEIHADAKDPYMIMEIGYNNENINRFEIILKENNTYTLKFWTETIDPISHTLQISNEKIYENILYSDLQKTFKQATGMDTRIPAFYLPDELFLKRVPVQKGKRRLTM